MELFLVFCFGACIGSFLNVVILRLPGGKNLQGRSACPHCGHRLGVRELFPLFSFLFLSGRCAACGKKISPRYFLIESVCGLLFVFAWQLFLPFNIFTMLLLFRSWLVISLMIVVFAVDFEHYVILDEVVLFGVITGLGLNVFLDLASGGIWRGNGYFFNGLLAALAAVLPFFLLWFGSKGRWMGFGDVKLAILLGMLLGWPQVFVCLFLAIMLGGFVSGVLLALHLKNLKSALPFGTFLSLAAVAALFFGQFLLKWYLSLLGF